MTKARRSIATTSGIGAVLAFLLAGSILSEPAFAQDIVTTEMRIPTPDSGKKGLEAVMVRPNDAAPHPLALITHGTPREATERAEMTPLRWIPQAREFARRGWTAVIVMRRGFGDSGGDYAELSHACSRFPNYMGATEQAVRDLREATAYLETLPEVDRSRMISIGVSTGGLATVGLTADPLPGLVAAINFAGGRGSEAPDQVCNPDDLIETFAEFGKRSRVPMLWIYAANDHYFGPAVAQNFYRAFTQNGGKATFIAAGPYGEDGHHLFSLGGIPIWTPMVDDFLKSQNLVLRDSLLQVSIPAIQPPAYLSSGGRNGFQTYLLSAPHKAFAASPVRGYSFSVGQRTTQKAEELALDGCKKQASPNTQCSIVMIDDKEAGN